jgi:hypothetical protein
VLSSSTPIPILKKSVAFSPLLGDAERVGKFFAREPRIDYGIPQFLLVICIAEIRAQLTEFNYPGPRIGKETQLDSASR